MTEQQARWSRWIMRLSGLVFLVYGVCHTIPKVVVYAPSSSLAKGWYLRDPDPRPIAVGDIVAVHMPPSVASIPEVEGLPPRLLKHVGAVQGDRVCWDAGGMTVWTNQGVALYPYHRESVRYSQQYTCVAVPDGQLVLVGTHPRSFDSRYIGMVDGALLDFRVFPFWTWETS